MPSCSPLNCGRPGPNVRRREPCELSATTPTGQTPYPAMIRARFDRHTRYRYPISCEADLLRPTLDHEDGERDR